MRAAPLRAGPHDPITATSEAWRGGIPQRPPLTSPARVNHDGVSLALVTIRSERRATNDD